MKNHALPLIGLCLLVGLLGASPAASPAATQGTSTATITRTTTPALATPTRLAPLTATPTPDSSAQDAATRILDALEANETLDTFRLNVSYSIAEIITPTAKAVPFGGFDLAFAQNQENAHSHLKSVSGRESETIRIGDEIYSRDLTGEAGEGWFLVPAARRSEFSLQAPHGLFQFFMNYSTQFTKSGEEELDGMQCEVYAQDRLAVITFFIRNIFASDLMQPEAVEEMFEHAESRVWVCEDGYLHRLELNIATKPEGEFPPPLELAAVVELLDPNGDIDITAPENAVPLPSPTPIPSKTPVPSATPRPTVSAAQATATAEEAKGALQRSANWDVVLSDTFDSNDNHWTEEDGKTVADGKYKWVINDRVNIYRGVPEMATQSDFAASLDVQLVNGSPDCGMGITFRNGPDYLTTGTEDYVFYIHNDGRWGFDIIHHPDPLIAQYGATDAIVPKALNRLQVVAEGDHFSFFVNGKYVGSAQDETLLRGKVGAAVWVLGPGSCEVQFDNFQVSAPEHPFATRQGKIILTDWTAENPNEWQTGEYAIQDARGSRTVEGTKYLWETTSASEVEVIALPQMEPIKDFDVSVDARQLGGSQRAHYGLVVRHTDSDNTYSFHVTGYGSYGISYNKEGEYDVLDFGVRSPAIKVGEVNRLRVVAHGPRFLFFVNDEVIAELIDDTFSEGTIGLMVETYDDEQPGGTFEFSNFELRELGADAGAEATLTPTVTPTATVILTATPTRTESASGGTAGQRMEAGIAAVRQGNYQAAVTLFDQAIELDPAFVEAYYNRGLAYTRLGDGAQAIADFTKAIELDPALADAYNNRGLVLFHLGRYDEAESDYKRATEIAQQLAQPFTNLGNLYRKLGRLDEALENHTKAIERAPTNADGYYNRGLVYIDKGERDLALADMNKAIEIGPEHVDYYFMRGYLHGQDFRFAEAIPDFTRVIELDPTVGEAYYFRGLAHKQVGNAAEAIADLTHYLEFLSNEQEREHIQELIQELQEPAN